MMSLYEQLISLLGQCHSAEIFASMRSRYAAEGDDAIEVESARRSAKMAWIQAKTMYCQNKEELDAAYKQAPNNIFTAMRDVIEKEAREAVEKEVLG